MNKDIVIILPLVIPLFTAVLCIFFWFRPAVLRALNIAGSLAFLASTIQLFLLVYDMNIITSRIGNWQTPFGIILVVDLFSAVMVLAAGILGSGAALYAMVSMEPERMKYGFFPLFHILLMGICGAFLTGDIFNLYVWFEVILISSFVLMALGSEKGQLEGAIKYVTLNFFGSVIFLTAVGMLYGITGALNMADLAIKVASFQDQGIITINAMLFMVAFGIKAAVFPLFFWLPASYHTPPVAVSAIFAGLLTKVGVYAMIRIFTLIFTDNTDYIHFLLLLIASFTMVTGVIGAVAQTEIRRLLSFHIISQIGYMIMGLAFFTPLAIAGAIYFMFHNIIVKNTLFLVSGLVYKIKGHYQLKYLGGLYRSSPFFAILFLIPALSLAGMPPLSGFWGKFLLIKAGLEQEQYIIVGVSLAVGFLTLFSMIKIWNEAFWKKEIESIENVQNNFNKYSFLQKALICFPVIMLCLVILLISFFAGEAIDVAYRASFQLLNPEIYIKTVLQP